MANLAGILIYFEKTEEAKPLYESYIAKFENDSQLAADPQHLKLRETVQQQLQALTDEYYDEETA